MPQASSAAEVIELRYIPIDDARLFEANIKKHDIGLLASSIVENGFRNPPLWDTNLNNGQGGIIAGNGRIEALQWMQAQGQSIPRGIRADEQGNWLVPVIFGCDARDEQAAKRFCLTDNILTMSGGDFSAHDISKLFDEDFIPQLQALAATDDLPLGFDGDYLDSLIAYNAQAAGDNNSVHQAGEDQLSQLADKWQILITCQTEVQQSQLLEQLIEQGHECRALVG